MTKSEYFLTLNKSFDLHIFGCNKVYFTKFFLSVLTESLVKDLCTKLNFFNFKFDKNDQFRLNMIRLI